MQINNSVGVRVIMDPSALAAYIAQPNGPVVRDMVIRAGRVQEAAKRQIRMGHIGGAPTKTSRANLRDTIVKRVVKTGQFPSVMVGSDSPIAWLHHEGTKPHIIKPVNSKFLVFWSSNEGGTKKIFAKLVHHPGTKPNHYLTDNLWLAL